MARVAVWPPPVTVNVYPSRSRFEPVVVVVTVRVPVVAVAVQLTVKVTVAVAPAVTFTLCGLVLLTGQQAGDTERACRGPVPDAIPLERWLSVARNVRVSDVPRGVVARSV